MSDELKKLQQMLDETPIEFVARRMTLAKRIEVIKFRNLVEAMPQEMPQPKTATLVIDEHGNEMQISLREDGKYELLGAFYTLPKMELVSQFGREQVYKKGIEFVPVTEMVLLCPQCHRQHIDRDLWATQPHKTHLCEFCMNLWRPFEYYTVGVEMKNPPYSAPFTEDVPQCCGNPTTCPKPCVQFKDALTKTLETAVAGYNPLQFEKDEIKRLVEALLPVIQAYVK